MCEDSYTTAVGVRCTTRQVRAPTAEISTLDIVYNVTAATKIDKPGGQ